MPLRLRLHLPPRIDSWLWKHCRPYRRQQIRQAKISHLFHCDICHTTDGVSVLKNGGQLCSVCREVLENLPLDTPPSTP
jgi:hypothetical protein